MTIVGIAGGSASGKSTLSSMVEDLEKSEVIHASLDDFYKPVEEHPETFDDPSALDWCEVAEQVSKFHAFGSMDMPKFSFEEGDRVGEERVSGDHLIIEGIWALHRGVRDALDVKIFIDTPVEVRMARRIRRDTEERGCGPFEALELFEQALEKEQQHVLPTRKHANFVIEGRPDMDDAHAVSQLL